MKHFYLILFLLVLAGCGTKTKTTIDGQEAKTIEPTIVEDLVYPEQGLFATDYKYLYFGKIGYKDRFVHEDSLLFPPIPGLVHQSVFAMCPKDTCFSEYTVLALRCPPIAPLLYWLSDAVHTFTQECPIGNGLQTYNNKEINIPKKRFKSAKDICEYYTGQLRHTYAKWHCTGEGDSDSYNEQAGLLIADSWNTGNLYTFYRIDWYDWMSGGNNARESWWTVDATSGKCLGLEDFIVPEQLDSLASLTMPRLVNGNGEYFIRQYRFEPSEYTAVLRRADGCALIPEGLIFYFYPYNLGSGADGQYEAVIPYQELNGILREPLSTVLVPSSAGAKDDARMYSWIEKEASIDLFGVYLIGSPKHILQEINKCSQIQIDLGPNGFIHKSKDNFSCRVLVRGVPFGMNVTYDNDTKQRFAKEVQFITSEFNHKILDIIVNELTDYYGEPDIIDLPSEYYTWYLRGPIMRVRRLHNGGWTFYIS